ncbi:MAG: hypothetical protein P9M14_09395 [Candidatus Alcyoniella australis]|nr:hypothetical protein [Candidatus Alcyoniella australis]
MNRERTARRWPWCLALGLGLVLAALCCFFTSAHGELLATPIDPYRIADQGLTRAQRQRAAQVVRATLADRNYAPSGLESPPWHDKLVVVGVFPRGAKPLIGWAWAEGELDRSLAQATRRAIENAGFRPRPRDLEHSSIRIDLAYRVWKAAVRPDDPLGIYLRIGVDGLLRVDRGRAILMPPYEVLLEPWEPAMGKRSRIRKSTMRDVLSQRAGVTERKFLDAEFFRLRCRTLIQTAPDAEVLTLDDGELPLDPQHVTAPMIKRALVDGSYYLVRSLRRNGDSGLFSYLYDPARQRYNGPLSYNIVRHAGCAYGLYTLGAALEDETVIQAADLATQYLLQQLRRPLLHPETLAVGNHGTLTLGAAALTLLALDAMPETRRGDQEQRAMLGLARFIDLLQHEDGRYYTDYHELVFDEPLTQAPYFPGEALLAMTRLYELRLELSWVREHCVRAADWQTAQFQTTGKPENWVVQGLARLHRLTGDERYAQTCFAMADALVDSQFPAGYKRAEWVGGFSNSRPPRTAPAGSRSEALREAYLLALELGDEERSARYGQALLLSTRFLITQMYGDQTSYYLPFPESARGGIRGSSIQSLVRIDYNQHALVGMLGAWEAAKRREQ